MNAGQFPEADPPFSADLNTAQSAEAALRTLWQLAAAWKLTIAEQLTLLGVTRPALYRWKQGQIHPLDAGVQQRLSHLFGIYTALQRLLPVPARAHQWLRKPNTAAFLAGRSALDSMLDGKLSDLLVVRHCLDAERGDEP